jgi:hypothetical protein
MSILLSAYYPEGIVYVADKNMTILHNSQSGVRKYVEPGTKVLSWPHKRAIVGYVGLGQLAGYSLDEWLRIFIAETRDFSDIRRLAQKLRNKIQYDFSEDFQGKEVSDKNLIIHLGGFTKKQGIFVPVLYHIWNHTGIVDPKTGEYPPGERVFKINEDIESNFMKWPRPEDYPIKVRVRLRNMIEEERYLWFNNGYNIGAFNVFKDVVWEALNIIKDHGFAPNTSGLLARVAFCRMAVELFGSYFTYHNFPEDRAVGGGSDAVWIPWPE